MLHFDIHESTRCDNNDVFKGRIFTLSISLGGRFGSSKCFELELEKMVAHSIIFRCFESAHECKSWFGRHIESDFVHYNTFGLGNTSGFSEQ